MLSRFEHSSSPPSQVEVVLAPERQSDFDDRPSPLHLRLHDLHHACALQHVAGESVPIDEYRAAVREFEDELTTAEMTAAIHQLHHSTTTVADMQRLQTSTMTPEERELSRFTRRNLQKLSNWTEWDAAFDAQLDAQLESGTFGLPVPRPTSVNGTKPNILRIQWSNLVKPSGVRKCRACADGSKRSAPWLRQFAQTYASCIKQPCMRLFFAIAAAKGLIVTTADTTNAFQQSPPPTTQCYLAIDDAYESWYQKRFGKTIDCRTHVIPLQKALQGHPEAGALWEKMMEKSCPTSSV